MESDARQLAAIMLTDIVGYTALTQTDEALTLALLGEHAALVRPMFSEHGGREVKSTGDGFLVEFPSALQAVRCAVEIQRVLHDRNSAVPLNRAIHVRIGIHLGDVVHRGGDIFGDGVNITARIEPLAEPGGICLSRQIYDQVWNKIDLRMASLGKKDLKNVKVQIEIYEMLLPWMDGKTSTHQSTDRSRLAVLPLVNISPDSSDEYFADGLTEELIFTLSKVRALQVIALTSVMKYREAKKAISEIGSELAVGTVLEGSVRKAGNCLRITLQLIDVASEGHLWSEMYDRTLDDVFAIQTEIARSVASALEVQLLPKPLLPAGEPSQASPEAYAAYLKGRTLLSRRTAGNMYSAIVCLEQSIELDPSRAETYAALSTAYSILPSYVVSAPADSLAKAKANALTALGIDQSLPEAHAAYATVLMDEFDWDGAERGFRKAIELSPSYAPAHHWLGLLLLDRGRFDEAIAEHKIALTLDPLSAVQHGSLGQVYFYAGQAELALTEFDMALALGEDNRVLRLFRGEAYVSQHQYELAQVDFERARSIAESFDPDVELALASLQEAKGVEGSLEEALQRTLEHAEQEPVSPYLLALFHFTLGRNDEGFFHLERAYAVRDTELSSVAVDPRLASCRSDPRFADLVKRTGFAH